MTTDEYKDRDTLLHLAATRRRVPKRMPADFAQKVMSQVNDEPRHTSRSVMRRIIYAAAAVAASLVIALLLRDKEPEPADEYAEMMYAQMMRAYQTGEEQEFSYENIVKSVRSHSERMMSRKEWNTLNKMQYETSE